MLSPQNDIIEGCKNGDRRCQELLYRQYYGDMLKLCQRYTDNAADASVLYNQAMLKVLENIGQFKAQGDVGAWIRRIVVNTCIDFCRAKIKFTMHPVDAGSEPDLPITPEVYEKYSAAAAMQLVKELPGNTGLVFNLFAIEGYSHQEIATALGIATGTSKWHLNEARRLLKQKLTTGVSQQIYSNVI